MGMNTRALVISIVSLALVAGCAVCPAVGGVVVRPARIGPPRPAVRVVRPAAVVTRPARPGSAYVWRDGYYVVKGGRRTWVAGAWILPAG